MLLGATSAIDSLLTGGHFNTPTCILIPTVEQMLCVCNAGWQDEATTAVAAGEPEDA